MIMLGKIHNDDGHDDDGGAGGGDGEGDGDGDGDGDDDGDGGCDDDDIATNLVFTGGSAKPTGPLAHASWLR